MKKKAIAITLVMCLVGAAMSLTGCGGSDSSSKSDDMPYAQYDLSEYVKVGKYKGLEMEKISVSVADEEVDAQVKENVKATKTTEKVKEGTVAKNDTVNIDYEGKIDGKTFDGGSATGADLTIGSGKFIDGFEDGLIGKKVGSTQTLNLQFPEDYQKADLAGKDVVFTVKINYIAKDKVPEYNDEWVKENSKVTTQKEYEKQVYDELYKEKEDSAKSQAVGEMWNEVVEDSEVLKYPEEEVDQYVKEIEQQYETYAESSGMKLEELWKQYGINSEEEYNEQNKQTAQAYVKEQMIMYSIANTEHLSYSEEKAEQMKKEIQQMGYTDETFKQSFGQDIDSYVVTALTFNEVGDVIFENAKVVDKKTDKKKDKEESTQKGETDSTSAPETPSDDGADEATSNDEEGGADA